MIEKHWHCSYCGDALAPGETAYMRIEHLIPPIYMCRTCLEQGKPCADTIDWAKVPDIMLEKQAFAKKMGIEFDEDGIPILRKRTPSEQMVYYMTKYTLLQAEKRELTEKLTIAVKALEFISRQRGTTSSGCASKALDKIHAIGKESDDG